NLAGVFYVQGHLRQAAQFARDAIARDPNYSESWNNLGNILRDESRVPEAIDAYRQAMRVRPNNQTAHGNLCYTLHFAAGYTPPQILAEHQEWSRQHELPLTPRQPHYANTRDPDRRLRVGYVSPDMREHPVGRALLPVLSSHDHERFE